MGAPVLFYTYPSCTSCRKTKAWLNEHGIQYEERHMYKTPPTVEELKNMLQLTMNGADDLLSKRSQKYKSLNLDFDQLSLNQLIHLLNEDPGLLRRPIITYKDNLIVGYDKEALDTLLTAKKSV
jgi:Spx/MgsR family transcriptional regulator